MEKEGSIPSQLRKSAFHVEFPFHEPLLPLSCHLQKKIPLDIKSIVCGILNIIEAI